MGKLTIVLGLLFSFTSLAQVNFCTNELETFPTRSGGRVKPIYVLANDTIKFITGESKVGELSAVEAFCKLTLKAFGMPLEIPINIKIEHIEVKKLLGMKEEDSHLPADQMAGKLDLIEGELAQQKENNSYNYIPRH